MENVAQENEKAISGTIRIDEKEIRFDRLLRLRQLTFIICNRSETNVRKIADTTQAQGEAYLFKEAQRMIYMCAKTSYRANIAFHRWVKLAEETGISELKSMTRTIRDKLDGMISFRIFLRISNAKMESFNIDSAINITCIF